MTKETKITPPSKSQPVALNDGIINLSKVAPKPTPVKSQPQSTTKGK